MTICALSTPYGVGGIAVVRISGPQAVAIVDSLFQGRKPLREAASHTAHFGTIRRGEEVLDEVVCTLFRAPHSFTGEEVVEISCHGSLYIQSTLVQWLLDAGCRMAQPGEFTRRAFMSGRMDLTQAEAVADLIAARSKAEKELALSQMRGSVSRDLDSLREQLLRLTSLLELELDFADHEDLEFVDRTDLLVIATEAAQHLARLTASFRTGQAIRHGIPVAIVGAPNAGKSTMLNALLGEERAIVSDVAGTTRDTVEDTVVLDGVLFRLVDTAGLRQSDDRIECMGMARSREAAERAQIILHLVDATHPQPITDLPEGKTVLTIWNKADLLTEQQRAAWKADGLLLSAREGDIASLKQALVREVQQVDSTQAMISNARHYEALSRAQRALEQVQQGLQDGLSGELLAMDLHDCLDALGEVTGRITSSEVLANIFSKFCIGK